MNAKQIVEAAAVDIGVTVSAAVVAATDVLTKQFLGLLNKEGRDLSRRYPWQAIRKEVTFVTTGVESQGTLGGIASTMRYMVNETFWNRSTQQPILGPVAPQDWQQLKAQSNSSPYITYTIRGNQLLLNPVPAAGQTCAFEYVMKTWCTDSTGVTYNNSIAADTDVMLLDDEIMLLGLIWRWKQAKGFEYGSHKEAYEKEILDAMARDGSKRRLSLSAGYVDDNVKTAIPRVIGL